MKAKKLTSILLILAIIVTLGISAFAAEVENGTITLKATDNQLLTGRTFSAYKLFSVTSTYVDSEGTHFNYVPTELLKAAVDADSQTTGKSDAEYVDYVSKLLDSNDRADFAAEVIKIIDAGTTATKYGLTVANDGETATATVPYGYYIIIETTTDDPDDNAAPMLFALDTTNIIITVKSSYEEFEKTARDESITATDAMDRAVGDTVTYDLNAKYPNIYDGMTEATHVFTDALGTGLALDKDSIVLTIDGLVVFNNDPTNGTGSVPGVTLSGESATGFTLTVDYLTLPNTTYTTGLDVVVTYNAVITSDAVKVVGKPLENKARLDFDHDGGSAYKENGFKIYTYGFDFMKTNALTGGDPLAGALFALYANTDDADADTGALAFTEETVIDATTTPSTSTTYYVYNSTGSGTAVITSGSDGKVNIYGLDVGTYYLKETQPPSGYNPLDTLIKVTITAVLDPDTSEPTGTRTVAYAFGVKDEETGEYTFTNSDSNTLRVVNSSSIELPSTGGIGTIMFGIFGCLIIVGGVTGCTMLVIKLKRRYSASR